MKNDEFYIGWMGKAPRGFSRWIKRYLLVLLPIVIVLGVLLALSQKKFDTGNFEFGTLTEVKGIYSNTPVPSLKVVNGKDILGNENYITVPLIGYGKHGADGIIADLEKEKNANLQGKEVILKGTLLYNDGKLLMQIDANDKPLLNVTTSSNENASTKIKDLGIIDVKGEIMNKAVKDFVASPVELHAKAVVYDDWVVLYVNAENGLQHYSYINDHYGNMYASCSVACSK